MDTEVSSGSSSSANVRRKKYVHFSLRVAADLASD